MITAFKKIFGTKNTRDIKKLEPLIKKINSYEEKLQQLSDEELNAQTPKFKQIILFTLIFTHNAERKRRGNILA